MRRYIITILTIISFLATIAQVQGCSGEEKESYKPHARKKYVKRYDSATLSAVISPKAYYAIIATKEKFPALWGLVEQKELYQLKDPYTLNAQIFNFSEDNRTMAVASDKVVTLWNIESGKKSGQFKTAFKTKFMEINDNATFVLLGTDTGMAQYVVSSSGRVVREFNHGAELTGIALSPSGEIVGTAGKNNQVKVWKVSNARRMFSVETPTTPNYILLDDYYLFTATPQGYMTLWSAVTGDKLQELNQQKTTVTAARLDSKRKLLLLATMPNVVMIWDILRGKMLAEKKLDGLTIWTQGQRYVLSVAFGEKPGEVHIEDANGIGEILFFPELKAYKKPVQKPFVSFQKGKQVN